jgi:hypothetical protein
MNSKPFFGPEEQQECARRRAEYWKAEHLAANREIEAMRAVIDAVRCLRRGLDGNGGMTLNGELVNALWRALEAYDNVESNDR